MPSIATLLAKHKLDPDHPKVVMTEAKRWQDNPGIHSAGLVDLTHLPFVTIDEYTSKDLDQAVYIERFGEGHRVHYALADASYYVRPGSALYTEALRRGASFYLPGIVIPMLPKMLSEDLISLNPGVDRRALVFTMTVDERARITDTTLQRARVRSRAKLAWEQVQAYYDGGPSPVAGQEDAFDALREVGARRMALADERNVVRFRRREVVVKTAEGPGRFIAESDDRLAVELYNEQISLLANTEGARFLEQDHPDAHPIYRVHSPPTEARLRTLTERIEAIAASHHLDWSWHPNGEPLADFLRSLPSEGARGRVAASIHRAAMRSSGRAQFSVSRGGHHGVGADVYGRFTAPMREIVGVFLHEEAVEKLRGAPFPETSGWSDDAVRDRVIAISDSVRSLQRKLDQQANRMVLDQLFEDDRKSGTTRRGTVMEIAHSKAFVALDEPAIEVKVYRQHLEAVVGERLSQDGVLFRGGTTAAARLGVGQAVTVSVVGRDAKLDRWHLRVEPA
ncbi:MAG: RNB domain-containing ribonuclease [Proteobacteria bacterium]|nr:RNB domain-containing ribonuclease [Pseudomonadota bacterium]